MSAHEVLTECQARDVRLSAANGSLIYDAPKGGLSPDLLALLEEHKAELLAALTQPADLAAIFGEACHGVDGIEAATFRALLSPEASKTSRAGISPGDAQRPVLYLKELERGLRRPGRQAQERRGFGGHASLNQRADAKGLCRWSSYSAQARRRKRQHLVDPVAEKNLQIYEARHAEIRLRLRAGEKPSRIAAAFSEPEKRACA